MNKFNPLFRRLSKLEPDNAIDIGPRWSLLDCDVKAKLAKYKAIFENSCPESSIIETDANLVRYREYFGALK